MCYAGLTLEIYQILRLTKALFSQHFHAEWPYKLGNTCTNTSWSLKMAKHAYFVWLQKISSLSLKGGSHRAFQTCLLCLNPGLVNPEGLLKLRLLGPTLVFGLVPSSGAFPNSWVGKESACNAGDPGSSLGSGRSTGEGIGYPLLYSGLENSMDCIVHGVAKCRTQLSDFHFHFLHVSRKFPCH